MTVKTSKVSENWLFLKRVITNPMAMGAVVPASDALGNLVGQNVTVKDGEYIVEIGGGTGQLTRGLLRAGIPLDRLYVVELDQELYLYLKKTMPEVNLILGDACNLKALLPPHIIGKISSVVSAVPLFNMSFDLQKKLIDSSFSVMSDNGEFIQYTYSPMSPIPSERLGLIQKRVGKVLFNVPPASVWRYQRPVFLKQVS
jgi:phosphatidylethanolamine/phosphatidyl-N-methylethanolamine N-methyltransferase